jgi:hypothetical protein
MATRKVPSPKTAKYIKQIAAEGLARPSGLNAREVQELAASVMSHIEPRVNNTTVCKPTPAPKATKRPKK